METKQELIRKGFQEIEEGILKIVMIGIAGILKFSQAMDIDQEVLDEELNRFQNELPNILKKIRERASFDSRVGNTKVQ